MGIGTPEHYRNLNALVKAQTTQRGVTFELNIIGWARSQQYPVVRAILCLEKAITPPIRFE